MGEWRVGPELGSESLIFVVNRLGGTYQIQTWNISQLPVVGAQANEHSAPLSYPAHQWLFSTPHHRRHRPRTNFVRPIHPERSADADDDNANFHRTTTAAAAAGCRGNTRARAMHHRSRLCVCACAWWRLLAQNAHRTCARAYFWHSVLRLARARQRRASAPWPQHSHWHFYVTNVCVCVYI